jgi:metallo-beta-lactamase family protein
MNNKNKIEIQFLGAAGTVTGSKYLIQTNDKKILVDCGLFQGLKKLRLLNWDNLPLNVANIDIVLLTHGHLDHVGYLPRLVNQGFAGPIWGTIPTLEIAKIILEDSARIQEEDAERANAEGFSKHKPAKPLYNTKDVEKTLPLFRPQELDKWIEIDKEIFCRFRYNGHIIGATFIELKIGNKIIVFSGDIGRDQDLLMDPPQKPEKADVILIESTYGNRLHLNNAEERLTEIINNAAINKGTIIIPSFAVERAQPLKN